MVEKIKNMADAIKTVLLYVVAPLMAILGYFLYLTKQNSQLQAELNQSKSEKELAGTLARKEDAANAANKAEREYLDVKRVYTNQRGTGSGEGSANSS